MLCKAVDQKGIDYVVMGRRGLGTFERMLLGSTSKYVIENAKCNVIIAKMDVVKKQKDQEEDLKKSETFHSDLNHNISILAEEEERLRRMQEEKVSGSEEQQHARVAAKVSELIKDEQLRKSHEQSILEAHQLPVENLSKKE